MSLDYSLFIQCNNTEIVENESNLTACPIRENGTTRYLTVEEFESRYPGQEVILLNDIPNTIDNRKYVFDENITHNLGKMADKIGVYTCLWRLEETPFRTAGDIQPVIYAGLVQLSTNPEFYRQFNPENGWGTYEGLLKFLIKLNKACLKYPMAEIEYSR